MIKFLIGIYLVTLIPKIIKRINEKEINRVNKGSSTDRDNG